MTSKTELAQHVIAGKMQEVYCDTKLGMINITAIRETFDRLRRERGIQPRVIELHVGLLDWIKEKGDIDEERVKEVDITDPCIGVDLSNGIGEAYLVPIDGFHRITKALRAGVTALPFWYLSKDLVDRCFLVDPDDIKRMPQWGKEDHPADKMVNEITGGRLK